MVTEINSKYPLHIVTIEDPIEFVHEDKVGLVTQRQLGIDTHSFLDALRTVVRQDPNVILVGEMRDADTVRAAISAAETGHLVFSTLHTGDAVETINRLMDYFPQSEQKLMRAKLAACLRAVVSQRLVPRQEGKGRVAAVEILVVTTLVREIVREGQEISRIGKLMEEGEEVYGTQTFDRALYNLWKQGLISQATALDNASSPQDLSLKFRGLVSATTGR
jgi:twitching motility protein PilT